MRTWRSPMSATSQGAFVVIPEISLYDISYIIKNPRASCLRQRPEGSFVSSGLILYLIVIMNGRG